MADRNFKKAFLPAPRERPSGAPQRHLPAIHSPELGTHVPSAGWLHPVGTPEPGLERRSAARAGTGHTPQER